jgi:hypothetical protein
MTDEVRDGSVEKCYFCGINYIEHWPLEILAATVCPDCASMSLADLAGKYPDEMAALNPLDGCSCGGGCHRGKG